MKANAPEKIYISNFDIEALPKNEQLSERWHEVSTQDTDIEYTRTDAFIEKAVFWIRNNWREYVNVDNDGVICFGHWEKDFINFMKGERL